MHGFTARTFGLLTFEGVRVLEFPIARNTSFNCHEEQKEE